MTSEPRPPHAAATIVALHATVHGLLVELANRGGADAVARVRYAALLQIEGLPAEGQAPVLEVLDQIFSELPPHE